MSRRRTIANVRQRRIEEANDERRRAILELRNAVPEGKRKLVRKPDGTITGEPVARVADKPATIMKPAAQFVCPHCNRILKSAGGRTAHMKTCKAGVDPDWDNESRAQTCKDCD